MGVTRFQVMSLLQAARAYALGLPLESACSWGLNRAIFIAAAKRGFKGGSSSGEGGIRAKGTSTRQGTYSLGDDIAYKTEKNGVLLFTIGGKIQTKQEFDMRVKARFGKGYQSAWKDALAYVKSFDRDTLLSTDEFFRNVYKPVRDELAQKWTEASQTNAK